MKNIELHNLSPALNSKHKKKILGHGRGTGHGGSSTRGCKGQTSHSGSTKRPGFEGGQTPLVRRIPKRGFSNESFAKKYNIVNIGQLEQKFDSDMELSPEVFFKSRVIKKKNLPVKILAGGNLNKSFTIKAQAFSKSAQEKIRACGGKIEIIKQ